MAKEILTDELWAVIEPLLPPPVARPHGGRPRLPDRAVLRGIIFVLKTGLAWEDLPQEMGCGSGMTCWRRLRDWQAAGVWARLHRTCLDWMCTAGCIEWERAAIDAGMVPAPKGGSRRGRIPQTAVNRARSAM